MVSTPPSRAPSPVPGLAAAAAVVGYAILVLAAEEEMAVGALLAAGLAIVIAAGFFGLLRPAVRSFSERENLLMIVFFSGLVVITGYFHDDHFVLLLIATLIVYLIVTLGLNVQLGYAGVLNFAGASFFGMGCYTAAVLTAHTAIPHLLILAIGGVVAAVLGSVLIFPVLRTRGHYSAVVTIAFALLFKTLLEVNDALGGPQGMAVGGMRILGWDFNANLELGGDVELAFYVNYVVFGLVLLALAFVLVRRLERSWVGLNLDAVRLDQTAAACFGFNVPRWKITAFTFGNFLAGLAGAYYAMMMGFIAPTNFTFGDSLIFLSIVLLGGMGNPWGLVVATAIVVLLPEKLQFLQEYRFLLYASLVILILLFRPDGLLPRPPRAYFPGLGRR
ncbi:MAG: branched-chain amino acid ABC transporter permease [Gammaproteobacteria bacterium]|nr:branched-chain amino acid ABC transporter permease [Gammaproteobacteria bacterium]NIR81755.1 branched-chain amino acid ABC transporter permease [Gammaproteobacteria bacterium]NIR88558.1 branched-chain amino acid ABC transporter permease [Gammaproteobacteria bacterium]NIU02862.1 branched-chain amino acid ABC transporter permease [Gammaproteobacteria bacterium]NIV50384.1 branched-chain amino acid ABC transporter permease [Gammaproteobacteria bacterium]